MTSFALVMFACCSIDHECTTEAPQDRVQPTASRERAAGAPLDLAVDMPCRRNKVQHAARCATGAQFQERGSSRDQLRLNFPVAALARELL
jgi:nucleoside phosphorylase